MLYAVSRRQVFDEYLVSTVMSTLLCGVISNCVLTHRRNLLRVERHFSLSVC